jgi:hypothetical protein
MSDLEMYNWAPYVTKWIALVKMDDTAKTGSNGGIVVDVCGYVSEGYAHFGLTQIPSNYLIITCSKNVRPGWIYTDKTNIFIDSNKL